MNDKKIIFIMINILLISFTISGVKALVTNNDVVFTISNEGFVILDVSDYSDISEVSKLAFEDFDYIPDLDQFADIYISGDYAFVCYTTNEWLTGVISIIDIKNLYYPVEVGNVINNDTVDDPSSLTYYDDILYVGTWDGYLTSIDVSNPYEPEVIDYLDGYGSCKDIFYYMGVVFCADSGGDTFYSFNASDPYNLSELDSVAVVDAGSEVRLSVDSGDVICYVSSYQDDSLYSINCSDPTNLSILDETISDPAYMNNPQGLTYYDNICYVLGTANGGVTSFNVTDPTNIIFIDQIISGLGVPYDCELFNEDYLILSDASNDGIRVVNITDPTDLNAIGSYLTYLDNCVNVEVWQTGKEFVVEGFDFGFINFLMLIVVSITIMSFSIYIKYGGKR